MGTVVGSGSLLGMGRDGLVLVACVEKVVY